MSNINLTHHHIHYSIIYNYGEFPAQRASNAENVSIWWRHHANHNTWTGWNTHYDAAKEIAHLPQYQNQTKICSWRLLSSVHLCFDIMWKCIYRCQIKTVNLCKLANICQYLFAQRKNPILIRRQSHNCITSAIRFLIPVNEFPWRKYIFGKFQHSMRIQDTVTIINSNFTKVVHYLSLLLSLQYSLVLLKHGQFYF